MTFDFDFTGSHEDTIQWERGYWFDEERIADNFGVELSARLQDLLNIAMATYVADRRALRPPLHKGEWRRNLALRIGVQEIEFWANAHERPDLAGLLGWLTEDTWAIEFVETAMAARPATQRHLFANPPVLPTTVALFSGGLDSLAGAAADLSSGKVGELILVAASSNIPLRRVQFELVRGLRQHGLVRHVNVPLNLVRRVAGTVDERTQRSRGFLYVVLGAVVAELAGVRRLSAYENGVGALNLSFAESQVGAQSSRAVHPKTLRLASEFLSLVLDHQFDVVLPNFCLTKGTLCSKMPAWSRPLIGRSVSCDGFPSRIAGRPSCGGCTSCLLRRQALSVAGLSGFESPAGYLADRGPGNAADRATENLHDMLAQASTIELRARDPDAWASLARRFPALAAVDDPKQPPLILEASRREVLSLLTAYSREWRSFPSDLTSLYFPSATERRLAGV